MYQWELHYEAEAIDVLTGIRVCVDDFLSCDTAIETAISKVLKEVQGQ